jgi:hypothetical protein
VFEDLGNSFGYRDLALAAQSCPLSVSANRPCRRRCAPPATGPDIKGSALAAVKIF